ncbi:hypothetical protein VOLCADRAFT_107025 [Volvox carteri f. nagariensis]|uniref:Uncharacterized protein n=1 Tax=Volvox carteri f. nagariensis TaxID=3068 RepID=D8UBD8_VOLCA|nr:uncharacterized protein VOLCADRAFT_107025 [Volvox carteri f. nagariensis]EFJ42985.1 hypothetical protein VOLCADRAFT_107025 [Volvox carteri f. nagariensis]|eukprot:XP_002956025.1 hypothetical protein VOLCADRAFT_107025 [Volvox carteri f. nagariensis]
MHGHFFQTKADVHVIVFEQGHGDTGLAMRPLPILDGSDVRPPLALRDWVQTLPATLQETRTAATALRDLVQDAVYLDEECYSSAVEHTHYHEKLHVQQKRVHDLENEAAALRAELERKDELLTAAAARQREAQRQIAELQQELENNAVVFRMHYQELLTRNEEIERLKTVIEGLQGGP